MPSPKTSCCRAAWRRCRAARMSRAFPSASSSEGALSEDEGTAALRGQHAQAEKDERAEDAVPADAAAKRLAPVEAHRAEDDQPDQRVGKNQAADQVAE